MKCDCSSYAFSNNYCLESTAEIFAIKLQTISDRESLETANRIVISEKVTYF